MLAALDCGLRFAPTDWMKRETAEYAECIALGLVEGKVYTGSLVVYEEERRDQSMHADVYVLDEYPNVELCSMFFTFAAMPFRELAIMAKEVA